MWQQEQRPSKTHKVGSFSNVPKRYVCSPQVQKPVSPDVCLREGMGQGLVGTR